MCKPGFIIEITRDFDLVIKKLTMSSLKPSKAGIGLIINTLSSNLLNSEISSLNVFKYLIFSLYIAFL